MAVRAGPDSPDEAGLRKHLALEYGFFVRALTRLSGADPVARAYRLDTDTDPWFVKVRPVASTGSGRVDGGVEIATHLGMLGLPELLVPVRSSAGHAVTELDEAAVVVWPYVPGQDGFERRQSASTLQRVGSVLRAVHDLPVPAELVEIVPVDDPGDRWRRAVKEWYEAESAPHDALVADLVRLVARHRNLVMNLVSATEQLSTTLPEPAEIVLCHGDLHAGNALVDRDGRVTILDWDSAVLGVRERDLMFPGAAIGGAWTQDREVAAFLAGYGALPGRSIDPAVIAYHRGDRVLADVALFTDQILDPRAEDRGRALRLLGATLGPGDAAEAAERSLAALA